MMVPAPKKVAPKMFTGDADLAKTKLSNDQPPNSARAHMLLDLGEGRSQVTPAVSECRMSKSEFPRSILGLAIVATVFGLLIASVEASSMQCEKVYDANPCIPREKRRWNLSCSAW